jgi:hypothetical protein
LEIEIIHPQSPPTRISSRPVEILEQIFAEKSQHPGPSHYLIHAYDYPALVDRALATAQNFGICVTVVTMTQLKSARLRPVHCRRVQEESRNATRTPRGQCAKMPAPKLV